MAMDRHYGGGFGMPGPTNHNAAATLPPGVGPRGLSFSTGAGVYGEATPAAARQYSYPSVNVPFHSNTLPANFPGQQFSVYSVNCRKLYRAIFIITR